MGGWPWISKLWLGCLLFLKTNSTFPLGFVDCLHILTSVQIPAFPRGESKVCDFSFRPPGEISPTAEVQPSRAQQLATLCSLVPTVRGSSGLAWLSDPRAGLAGLFACTLQHQFT